MAGSQSDSSHPSRLTDPILAARLEAIKQLASGLSDRVAVMDHEFNLIYANKAAWASDETGLRSKPQAKCYEAFAQRTDPCGTCPAIKVFEAPEAQSVSCSTGGDGTACGMRQAFPLADARGNVVSMLVLFKPVLPVRDGPGPAVSDGLLPSTTRECLGELMGRSQAMQELFDMMNLVAESQATVLIQGESGTGKELVAQTIHRLSSRREKPFIVVDCGSLPETLLESELFGHNKGAFTGAVASKRGLFEEADGGTLFLDEIGDTTTTFQAKLLRVLQEGEMKRVGGNHRIKVDVRVISATNRDLSELVRAKTFRQDLYYRLAVLPLYLPPLRERREDIPLLADHFIAWSCQRHHQPIRPLSVESMRALCGAAWPGNVRELQHCIERAVITTTGPELLCDLVVLSDDAEREDLPSTVRKAVSQAERDRIVDALAKTSGNRVKAAKLLKISRASLYNKLRTYSIQ